MFYKNNKPFKRQPHKMVKHTQAIRRLLPTNCLNEFDHFVGLALKGLKSVKLIIYHQFLGPLFFFFDFMYHHVLEL